MHETNCMQSIENISMWEVFSSICSETIQDFLVVRDMFHIYLNRCEFHLLRLHINKTNIFYFLIHNRRIPGMVI